MLLFIKTCIYSEDPNSPTSKSILNGSIITRSSTGKKEKKS